MNGTQKSLGAGRHTKRHDGRDTRRLRLSGGYAGVGRLGCYETVEKKTRTVRRLRAGDWVHRLEPGGPGLVRNLDDRGFNHQPSDEHAPRVGAHIGYATLQPELIGKDRYVRGVIAGLFDEGAQRVASEDELREQVVGRGERELVITPNLPLRVEESVHRVAGTRLFRS